ncbi:PREDICTED: peptide-N(4)-(N-acetyl-beta-glucosaminyl)asparagine amidase [Papilio xuthus]|uniref:Peptide-N(4)-(N-acetyl-beta-glucosaminyl)asparagine amidase n=1 Tax=Papilio xuthus TaxID=66420 RepID=A0AAJ6Z0C1_PAPXU|nr:PREDICTED: peptide-N(4)-(N-acetyl-beta-glucosaminyl)asparagine amidase [Papilio xuthus]XP_013162551.1 PREDICTED: peptide-N(4)-(N-acetyl-beta-glucosaminyl)asparagine amidase [Papilio xuthus]
MEDVARIAVIEQTMNDIDTFNKVLNELLQHIEKILENPHDLEQRILKSSSLKKAMEHEVFCEYLKYVGFKRENNDYIYPREQSLGKLRFAQVALKRKISICCGSKQQLDIQRPPCYIKNNEPYLKPVYLETAVPLFNRIEMLFNNVLMYEKDDMQEKAREVIPLVSLELKAIERVREHQRKLKMGEVKGDDLSFELALLFELMGWFKNEFFEWIDKPDCDFCGGETGIATVEQRTMEKELCTVEVFKCKKCERDTLFPRYNDVRNLLRTRRGRCGEWANCFALLCRALGYDTRHVFDTNDHVWVEIFNLESGEWLHVDPCEGMVDAPLVYSCGWGTRLAYVIAVSRDDVQDVTWRYTVKHKQVKYRRTLCAESDLVWCMMTLRAARQAQVSSARRDFLAKRTVKELVLLMQEKEPSDYEKKGRMSGALEWREDRGEVSSHSHTFHFVKPGAYNIQYCAAKDEYRVFCDGKKENVIDSFLEGAYKSEYIFRKVEKDWKQVYLARNEREEKGQISWKLEVEYDDLVLKDLVLVVCATTFEDGCVRCSVQFDSEPAQDIKLEGPIKFKREFKKVVVSCELTGGSGDNRYQHAQLFRQPTNAKESLLKIITNVVYRIN